MFNLYVFKVTFADGTTGQRNIRQNTYTAALNDLYFPGPAFCDVKTVNDAELIGLRAGTTWLGANKVHIPGLYDHKS